MRFVKNAIYTVISLILAFVVYACVWPSVYSHAPPATRDDASVVVVDRTGKHVVNDQYMRDMMDATDKAAERSRLQDKAREPLVHALLREQSDAIDLSTLGKYPVKIFPADIMPPMSNVMHSGPFWTDENHVLYRAAFDVAKEFPPNATSEERDRILYEPGRARLILLNVDTGETRAVARTAVQGEICYDRLSGRIAYPYEIPQLLKGQPYRYVRKRGTYQNGKLETQDEVLEGIEGDAMADKNGPPKFQTIDCALANKPSPIRSDDGILLSTRSVDEAHSSRTDYFTWKGPKGQSKRIDVDRVGGDEPSVVYDDVSNSYYILQQRHDLSFGVSRYSRTFDLVEQLTLPRSMRGVERFAKDGFLYPHCKYFPDEDSMRPNSPKARRLLCVSDRSYHKSAVLEGIPLETSVSPNGCLAFGGLSEGDRTWLIKKMFLANLCLQNSKTEK